MRPHARGRARDGPRTCRSVPDRPAPRGRQRALSAGWHDRNGIGNGWSLIVGTRLEVNPANDVTITEPGTGRRVTFKFTPQSFGGIVGYFYFPSYTPEPGVNGKLTADDACGLLIKVGGGIRCFPGLPYSPTTYTYTDVYGRAYKIGADGHPNADGHRAIATAVAHGMRVNRTRDRVRRCNVNDDRAVAITRGGTVARQRDCVVLWLAPCNALFSSIPRLRLEPKDLG